MNERRYKVHACSTREAQVPVVVAGNEVLAKIPQTLAELVPVEQDGTGTILVSVAPDSLELFAPDSEVIVSFAAAQ